MSHRKRNKKFKKGLGKWSTFFHKWLGLAIGIQVVLWILSGLIFTIWDIEVIRSEHNIAEPPVVEFNATDSILPLQTIIQTAGRPAKTATLKALGERKVYQVDFGEGEPILFDAATGAQITPVGQDLALELALLDFKPEAAPAAPVWLTETNTEYRNVVPVWMIDMRDREGTRIYISPDTGRVMARRSDKWRIFDFFWMLHIMDYEDRTDFNHPLLIFASVFALIFSITGIVMLFFRFKKKDFGLGGNGRKKA